MFSLYTMQACLRQSIVVLTIQLKFKFTTGKLITSLLVLIGTLFYCLLIYACFTINHTSINLCY
jgi:hypothetical protein